MRAWLAVVALALTACPAKREEQARSTSAPPGEGPSYDTPEPIAVADSGESTATTLEARHHVVFADRTSQAYLLLVDGPKPELPTREALEALVRERMPTAKYEAELALLAKLIQAVPPPPGFEGLPEDEKARLMREDLLGLHIDVLANEADADDALIPAAVLTDRILARDLDPEQRASAPGRGFAVLLRAEYRNQFAVRGLRLLQTLVRVYATETKALIHDPDTSETMSVAAFSKRRLQASIGNIADQLAVVPFPEPDGSVRMTTRGMRRFGSVDLELDGLPRDPRTLDRATHLLVGLAFKMVRLGEYDPRGYAVEVDDVITLARGDITQAFAGRPGKLPPCEDCGTSVRVHLVERESKPTDPHDHVVARVVAPRATSDAEDYVHSAWSQRTLDQLLGEVAK
ncbi:MAG: hypothetical protein AAF721_02265 [Myxococcota bacterium]